ncbi:hypothetical protein D0B54_21060 [Solimonas sp. K1W22B-7]|uniref:hypothetical protein n=1 Tax=Solimonas sp. K1W22B-7 TaxID=2303331 RepID=UPI000E33048C|nr:hypothetical protein [Solimonas sp. K1W22B-7]AXQ31017.1 hypothetical protein D0B54_21060 [Solimonas sp. K1W22B-7]
MPDFSKSERRLLRDLAADVYEAEAHLLLEALDASFAEWREDRILSSELIGRIHEFHQDDSRPLWSMYRGLKEHDIVARGIARDLLRADKVRPELLEKLRPLIADYVRGWGGDSNESSMA